MSNQRTWNCTGIPPGSHEPFDNFGPDCSVCGARKEDVVSNRNPDAPPRDAALKSKVPLIAGSVAAVLFLGGGVFASPYIPGACSLIGNCAQWQELLTKAESQAKPYLGFATKAQNLSELETARDRLQSATSTLKQIPSNAKIYPQVRQKQTNYQNELKALEERLSKEQQAQNSLNKAVESVKKANGLTQNSPNQVQMQQAKTLLQSANAQLKAIPSGTFAKDAANKKVTENDRAIAALNTQMAQASQYLPPLWGSRSSVRTPSRKIYRPQPVTDYYRTPRRIARSTYRNSPSRRTTSHSNLPPLWGAGAE